MQLLIVVSLNHDIFVNHGKNKIFIL